MSSGTPDLESRSESSCCKSPIRIDGGSRTHKCETASMCQSAADATFLHPGRDAIDMELDDMRRKTRD